ncbi:PilC/PilY family type IV pilus protein [Larsenimonas rhizosphaerae]|uniref:PilC/PilY family type IV pilus protein n=1 Tax=Larsenimonas rhizosphaerae TaxID=2944682 RepID=A0AA42CVJ8_9GAMM|nr:PilC/PilY family type IV pilus protein [Larsenimonas rhizosphaerae]MCX2525469.1 PilC/PilY family type IV pilus protein [Larsenimonas rhizosphaerae]
MWRLIAAVLMLCCALLRPALAEDTSIYLPEYVSGQPQVMIVFDNSGSMETRDQAGSRTRLGVAKQVIGRLIQNNPNVNFALTVFNANVASLYCSLDWYGRCIPGSTYAVEDRNNGGRVIQAFGSGSKQSIASRQQLQSTLAGLQAQTSTPLCETMYEVYRYLAGTRVLYGNQRASSDIPNADGSARSGDGNYISPLRQCENIYVVYVTDGLPQWDTTANNAVKLLTGSACGFYDAVDPINSDRIRRVENCLPTLTAFMKERDLSDRLTGEQHAYTFTIGFTTEQQLLEDAAQPPDVVDRGYFTAQNEDELTEAFTTIVTSILGLSPEQKSVSTTTTADGFQNGEYIYQPFFQPRPSERWVGNLKKYRFQHSASGDFWDRQSTSSAVESGGAGGLLRARFARGQGYVFDRRLRTVYTDLSGGGKGLPLLADINGNRVSLSDEARRDLDGTTYDMDNVIDWLLGADITGERATVANDNVRPWLMGDILHSAPMAINYACAGCSNGIRTLVFAATNEGMLHAFDGDSGQELWAFWPSAMADIAVYRMLNLPPLYHDPSGVAFSQGQRYGLDGSLARYTLPDGRGGFKTILAFGMRRGGFGYYALDITDPESPSLVWQISPDRKAGKGFVPGQSWSTPAPALVPGDRGSRKVFVMGAGYDTGKDGAGLGSNDTRGKGVYIVEADTGTLIRVLTAGKLQDSVPSDVLMVDSDGDGASDRLFFGDTGGNVWMGVLQDSDVSRWELQQVASLGRHENGSPASDRRFFNRPYLWRTTLDNQAIDVLVIGSGNRASPQSVITDDRLYLLNVTRLLSGEHTVSDVITPSELALVSVSGASTTPRSRSDRGWQVLFENPGQKILSPSNVLSDVLFYTSYVPRKTLSICEPSAGETYLHGLTLRGGQTTTVVRTSSTLLGQYIQETPRVIVRDEASYLAGVDADSMVSIVKDVTPDGEAAPLDEKGGVRTSWAVFPAYWYRE